MGFYSEEADRFLTDAGMHPDCIDREYHIGLYRSAMRSGLAESLAGSSLAMLPGYLKTEGPVPLNEPVLVLDAGGTTLRCALVHFTEDGYVCRELTEGPMPGSLKPLDKEEYLAAMVQRLSPYLSKARLVGFCFSYSAEITPERDGILDCFNKGVQVSGSRGMYVCRELETALRAAGHTEDRKWVLLNDTAATVFGAAAQEKTEERDGIIGFIVGTGTNSCISVPADRILHTDTAGFTGPMLVNMESGGYDGFPSGEGDRRLHAADPQPGEHRFEKMIAGAYQGPLVWLTARLAAEKGLFSPSLTAALAGQSPFETRELGAFLTAPEEAGRLSRLTPDPEDRKRLLCLCGRLAERAALIAALELCAILEELGLGRDPLRPTLIAAEGSTVRKYAYFRTCLEQELAKLAAERDLHYRLKDVPGANLPGAARAALLNS